MCGGVCVNAILIMYIIYVKRGGWEIICVLNWMGEPWFAAGSLSCGIMVHGFTVFESRMGFLGYKFGVN